jgi:uncharacterized protein (DUF58 family)
LNPSLQLQEVQQITPLELIARQVVEGFITGLHKSPFHGFSVEFAEHRLYNAGESTKHIDWRLFGRTEKLFVKRYEEETNLRCQLVLDCSSSMYYPEVSKTSALYNKMKFSLYSAAAIMHLLKKQRDAVGLSMFGDTMEVHIPSKSSSVHHKLLLAELEKRLIPPALTAPKKSSVTKALHQIAENIHKRSLVIIFSDMMDSGEDEEALFAALQHLKHNKHEVILFHVTDKQKELDFRFENRPYLFVDVETGKEVKAYPNEVKAQYHSAVAAYKKALLLKCGQYKIDFVDADIHLGFKQVLLPYLMKRQRLV